MQNALTPRMAYGGGRDAAVERRRILIAEDDDAMRSLLVETLSSAGYEVRGVADGAALLVELARRDGFHYSSVDLVLSDLRMPLCSGLEVFDAMAGTRVRRPTFVLLTAFPDEATVVSAERLGAVVIPKPVTMARLVVIVTDLVNEPAPR